MNPLLIGIVAVLLILSLMFGLPVWSVWQQGLKGEAAQKYPEYRHQEFIGAFAEALREGRIDQIIYVPTESQIPILEAGRLAPRASK